MLSKNKIIIIVVVILLLLLAGIGFWYFWQKASKQVGAGRDLPAQVVAEKQAEPEFKIFIKPADKKYDLDRDGISNEDEKKLGTSENSFDTDGDGLNDGTEINKWHTDPTKADTDGDGYSDGMEIIKGYNPLGPGKLKE